jgi:hypothetical protein
MSRWKSSEYKTAGVNGVVYEQSEYQPLPMSGHPAGRFHLHSLRGVLQDLPGHDFPSPLAQISKGDAVHHIIIDKQGFEIGRGIMLVVTN